MELFDWNSATTGTLAKYLESVLKDNDLDCWHYISYADKPKTKIRPGEVYSYISPGDRCWRITVKTENETVLMLTMSYSLSMVSRVNTFVTALVYGKYKDIKTMTKRPAHV